MTLAQSSKATLGLRPDQGKIINEIRALHDRGLLGDFKFVPFHDAEMGTTHPAPPGSIRVIDEIHYTGQDCHQTLVDLAYRDFILSGLRIPNDPREPEVEFDPADIVPSPHSAALLAVTSDAKAHVTRKR